MSPGTRITRRFGIKQDGVWYLGDVALDGSVYVSARAGNEDTRQSVIYAIENSLALKYHASNLVVTWDQIKWAEHRL